MWYDTTLQDPSLSAVGKGLVPSVLAFATEQSFIGPNMAAIFAEVTRYASPFVNRQSMDLRFSLFHSVLLQ